MARDRGAAHRPPEGRQGQQDISLRTRRDISALSGAAAFCFAVVEHDTTRRSGGVAPGHVGVDGRRGDALEGPDEEDNGPRNVPL